MAKIETHLNVAALLIGDLGMSIETVRQRAAEGIWDGADLLRELTKAIANTKALSADLAAMSTVIAAGG